MNFLRIGVVLFLYVLASIGRVTKYIFSYAIGLFSGIQLHPVMPKIVLARKYNKYIPQLPRISVDTSKIKFPKINLKTTWARALLIVLGGLFLATYWFTIVRGLPSPWKLTKREQEVSTRIYDRNKVLLYTIYKDKNRTLVSLDEVPNQIRLATLAAEDVEFYQHSGFSLRGITRSFIKNVREGRLTGGSTITQQLVKNALLNPEKTLTRKVKEILLSIQVEGVYSKDEILEMYLNEVPYGGSSYGISEAARIYFGKEVGALSLAESAYLAGLPKSPTKFSPFGDNRETGINRQKEVLHLMEVNGFIDEEQKNKALEETLSFAPNKTAIKAPHFVMYVKQQLIDRYGEDVVETGGLEVITTLDYSIQRLAEQAVSEEIDRLERLRVGNGAAIVMDPKTGEILAMVGSKDYFDFEEDGNVNVTTRLRQPGSSIKAVNYAYALSTNYTPGTIISDNPVIFRIAGQPDYQPRNYDGKFRGKITLRSALAESRNIPAVRILATYGVEKMMEMGKNMGIESWDDPVNYGLSLTLGGGEIKLTELASVYATIANSGRRPDVVSVQKVTNYEGKVLEELEIVEGEQVLDPRVSFQLIDILSDNNARTPAFGSRSALVVTGHPEVAVKTGTSNNLKDNLTVGFNQDYVAAVWVGNNDGSPMSRVASGVTGASPIWNTIMSGLLAEKESLAWEVPEGLAKINICSYTGTLPCGGCPSKGEWFVAGTEPVSHCSWQFVEQVRLKMEEEQQSQGQILPEAASTF